MFRTLNFQKLLFVLLLCVGSLVFAPCASAQEQPDLPLDAIQNAFSEGKTKPLINRTADRLEVFVLGEGMLYTRGQAHYVLDDFFEAFPADTFRIEDVAWAGESWFVLGAYRSTKETGVYRVYVRLRNDRPAQEGHTWSIREIHISVVE